MSRPRVKCPRCGMRRTLQTAIRWRARVEDEFTPVCSECWSELVMENMRHLKAVLEPGPRGKA